MNTENIIIMAEYQAPSFKIKTKKATLLSVSQLLRNVRIQTGIVLI